MYLLVWASGGDGGGSAAATIVDEGLIGVRGLVLLLAAVSPLPPKPVLFYLFPPRNCPICPHPCTIIIIAAATSFALAAVIVTAATTITAAAAKL